MLFGYGSRTVKPLNLLDQRSNFTEWCDIVLNNIPAQKPFSVASVCLNSYIANHDNSCTGTHLNRIITSQWEGMGDVGSARYEPALLPPCPTIRALSYSNCQRSTHSIYQWIFKILALLRVDSVASVCLNTCMFTQIGEENPKVSSAVTRWTAHFPWACCLIQCSMFCGENHNATHDTQCPLLTRCF